MTAETGFTLQVSQNKYLAQQARAMDAVITVTAAGLGDGAEPQAAEVILIDCSGSMDMPPAKIIAARRATRAAIDALRDGVLFAIVAGTERAQVVYPPGTSLVAASENTRAQAKLVVNSLVSNGGTAMGTWLTLADKLLGAYPQAVRHAMLFTDGRNEHESPDQLTRVLDQVRGRFVCDVRGIGDAWEPQELRRIVDVLNGHASGVAEFADMTRDFSALMRGAMRKVVPDVDLRLGLRGEARVQYVKQVYPSVVDLTEHLVYQDERKMAARLPTGAWADETREYQVSLKVSSTGKPIDQDTLAAVIEVDAHGETAAAQPGLVLVCWTDEPLQATRIDSLVSHYTGQQQLGDAVTAGCAAAARNDRETAEKWFGQAVQLAAKSGNETILTMLNRLLTIVDVREGKVRLKSQLRMTDLKGLELGANQASRTGDQPSQAPPSGPPQTCPSCHRINDDDALLCESCGHQFDPERRP